MPLDKVPYKLRIDPARLNIPIHEIRNGYRSAVYFWRTKRILEQDNHNPVITHQIFQRNDNVTLCGISEVMSILRLTAGYYNDYDNASYLFHHFQSVQENLRRAELTKDIHLILKLTAELYEISQGLHEVWVDKWDNLAIWSLDDGDLIQPSETMMIIEGIYSYFAHLESIYLGILARRTRVATNAKAVVQAAGKKQVLFFADRFDHFLNLEGDGYAARVGGVAGVSTDAMAYWFSGEGVGTIPHAIIAAYGGDATLAAEKFTQYYPENDVICLVDFDNDCVKAALNAARELGDRLFGVRLDTPAELVDKSLEKEKGDDRFGVAPKLVENVRNALDKAGFSAVKIIVSGGFTPDKIAHFESAGVPVDVYAVGSWMLSGRNEFTADAVRVDGKNLAKAGREYHPNDRLRQVH
jgi:nicotinate phosphoribosyltransferase